VTVYDFNPEKGKALLKEAGWENGDQQGRRAVVLEVHHH
jgi:ABC-type transport system substrate-binding protein